MTSMSFYCIPYVLNGAFRGELDGELNGISFENVSLEPLPSQRVLAGMVTATETDARCIMPFLAGATFEMGLSLGQREGDVGSLDLGAVTFRH